MSIQLSPRTPWTDEELRRMHDMAERGWTDHEIADALGRTLSSVQCKRRKVGSTRVRGGDLKVSLAARPCMRCRSPFRPEHRFNRLCVRCTEAISEIGLPWAA